MPLFAVDESICTRCGLCIADCPTHIIEPDAAGLPLVQIENQERCFKCQHCLAICPVGAVSVLGKTAADSRPLSDIAWPTLDQMDHFVRGRRSVRRYLDADVDKALVARLLASLAHVPTGCNAQELTLNVIDDKDVMRRFSDRLVTAALDAAQNGSSDHPFLAQIASMPREAVAEMIFRTAPHALIVSAPSDAPCPREDIALALAYFELLAQSAGLGTVWWGFLRVMVGVVPEARQWLGIPDGHDFYAMLFGSPAIRFARTTQKDDAARIRCIQM